MKKSLVSGLWSLVLVLCAFAPVREASAASPLGATFNNHVELKLWTNAVRLVTATNTGSTGQWSGSATQTWAYALQVTNGLGVGALSAISNVTLTATTQVALIRWTWAGGADGVRLWRGPQTTNLTQYLPMTAGATNFSDTGAYTNWVTNGSQTVTATNVPALILRDGTVINGAEDLGSPSAVTNGGATINGAPISNGAAITVAGTMTFGLTTSTAYNGASGAAASNLAAQAYAGLSDRLDSNVFAALDSTTNRLSAYGGYLFSPGYGGMTYGSIGFSNAEYSTVVAIGNAQGTNQYLARITVDTGSQLALWHTIWDSGNDGADSELDAGLLGGLRSTSFVQRVGGSMSGVLTNMAGFVGNGAGLTNLPVSTPSTNYILRASDRWVAHEFPTNPLAMGVASHSSTSVVQHQALRTLQTQQMTRTVSLTFSRTSSETNGWIGFAFPYVAQTNIVTNTLQLLVSGASQVVHTVNFTTSGFYTVASGSLSNALTVDARFTGFATSPGSTNYGLAFPPDIYGAAQ